MKKTYTQTVHYKFVIEGEYSCCNVWEEELYQNAQEASDNVLDYIGENIDEFLLSSNIKLTNLITTEEN